jgi:hypothetical protein
MKQGRVFAWATVAAVMLSLAGVSPGAAQSTVFDDMVPGSFLVFPLFDVGAGNSTQLRITNTGPDVRVQLNFVCPGSKKHPYCDALDRHKKLTPYETLVVDVATYHPPCDAGYVVAFAENASLQAIAFDYLIGSYHIVTPGSLEAAPAISIQSVKPENDNLGADGELQFGEGAGPDPDYRALPSHLYTDFRAVTPGASGSDLILLTLDSIAGFDNPVTSVDIDFWNEKEDPFSTSWDFVCWTRVPLEAIDPNFFESNLMSPHGSLRVTADPRCPIAAGCPPLEPFDPTILGAINEYDGSNRTKRNLFHDREPKSTVFVPR